MKKFFLLLILAGVFQASFSQTFPVDTIGGSNPIYYRLELENSTRVDQYGSVFYSYADLYVRFYSDQNCTNRISVVNLQASQYSMTSWLENYYNSEYNSTGWYDFPYTASGIGTYTDQISIGNAKHYEYFGDGNETLIMWDVDIAEGNTIGLPALRNDLI